MTAQYFFTCSIGPVQGFVATARTSQDLWFGSWMLSELAKAAAKALKDDGHILIFPAPETDLSPGSTVNVANKVVAILSANPQMVALQVKAAIDNRLGDLAKDSFAAVPSNFDRDEAKRQLDDLIEFYWAAVPYDESKGNDAYKQARARAEALIAARKNTRDFEQQRGKDGLPKSSLDGFRESVLPKESQNGFALAKFKTDKGEILSGIDLVKRLGKRPNDEKFQSTTDIAAKPFELYLGERCEPLRQAIEKLFVPIAERSETPGTLFYVERLVQLIDDEKKAKFREEFAELWREHKVDRQPSPYYALLQADGDNMGKTIDDLNSLQRHSDLSRALSTFAAQAKGIMKKYDGVPLYVGGDDILAYLPLHTALTCVKTLDAEFSKAMQEFGAEDNAPTLSVGFAIAHHLTPLSDVLEQARRAEKSAKRVKDKNGLAISLGKRGNAERVIRGKLSDLVRRMEELIELARQNTISHGAAYELEDLERRLNILDVTSEMHKAMLQKEAIRIIGRKRESGGDEKLKEETKEKFQAWLRVENLTLNELAGEMVIAAELANAYALARLSPKEVSA